MTPSYTQPSPAADKPVEFSVGQRQLAAIGFVSFLLLGLVATMSYVAGRITSPPAPASRVAGLPRTAATPAPSVSPEAPKAAAEAPRKPPVEQLIVVEAQTPPPPAAPAPTVTAPTVANVTPAPAVAGARPQPTPTEKLIGNTYLQVAAVDRGMAEVTCELLTRKGLPALIGDSPSDGIFRVLVGPIRNAADVPGHQAILAEAGFHPFVKKYN